jgi:hypothetical protein
MSKGGRKMLTVEQRKEKARLHSDLIEILTACNNDEEYYQRTLWALEYITTILVGWKREDEE